MSRIDDHWFIIDQSTQNSKRLAGLRSFVNDEGFMVTEDRWEDDESAATAPPLAASASTKAPSPKKKQAAGGSDVPAKKKATSQGSMFSFFKKK